MLITSNIDKGIAPVSRGVLEIKLGEQRRTPQSNGQKVRGVVRYDAWVLAARERSMLTPLQPIFGTEITQSEAIHDWRLPMRADMSINIALTEDSAAILNRRVDPTTGTMIGDCDGDTIAYAGRLSHRGPCLCKAEKRSQCQISVTLEGRLYIDNVALHPLVRSHNRSENLAKELAPAAELFERAMPGDVVLANIEYLDRQGTNAHRFDLRSNSLQNASYARLRIKGLALVPAVLLDEAAARGTLGELFIADYATLRARADALADAEVITTPLQIVTTPSTPQVNEAVDQQSDVINDAIEDEYKWDEEEYDDDQSGQYELKML
jgi:hypothetical protein